MAKLQWLMLAMLACSYVSEAHKILLVFPFPGKSHSILGEGIARILVKAGHEVTHITPIVNKKMTNPKLRQIDISDNLVIFDDEMINLKTFMSNTASVDLQTIFNFTMTVQQMTFSNPNVQRICKDPKEHFDVIIAEWMFNELYTSFSAIFKAPFIWVSTVDPHWQILSLIDQSTNPSYSAHTLSHTVPPFSFFERVEQLGYQIIGMALKQFYISGIEHEMYKDIQPLIRHRGHEVPDFEELRYCASMIIGNSHVSMGSAIALPQSYKAVGGYHIDPEVKPLPEDLQKLMDNAKHGVIYFSMGSNLKSKSLPDEVKKGLVQMFSTLKQTVIWKFEETLPGTPANLKIMQWAPQLSILAHPNCILFITHGGLLSTTETIHYGKPIIGIPVFADQFTNVARAVKSGYAKKVDLSVSLADDLKVAINEVITNPSYTKKVKELSFIYHHRPATPAAELVHWVEHVALTGGAPHLRSPALDVPFYQKYFLDLVALIAAVLLSLYLSLYLIIKRLFCKKKPQKKQKKN